MFNALRRRERLLYRLPSQFLGVRAQCLNLRPTMQPGVADHSYRSSERPWTGYRKHGLLRGRKMIRKEAYADVFSYWSEQGDWSRPLTPAHARGVPRRRS